MSGAAQNGRRDPIIIPAANITMQTISVGENPVMKARLPNDTAA